MKEYEALTKVWLNPIIIFASLFYLFLFLAGLINLGELLWRKVKKEPLTRIREPIKEFPLNKKRSIELILLIICLLILTHLLPGLIFGISDISPIYIILASNLLLQVGSIFIILKYINFSFFGVRLNKEELNFTLRFYAALVPVLLASLFINLALLEILGVKLRPSPIEQALPLIKTNLALFLFIIQAGLIGPLAEELVFRGLFYKLLRKRYSFLVAAIIISLFFALIHRSWAGVLGLFLISLALCYLYEKTQKISTVFIFHAFHNLMILLFFLGSI